MFSVTCAALSLTGAALRKSVNCSLVRVWVGLSLFREFIKRNVKTVVRLRDVLLEMLACHRLAIECPHNLWIVDLRMAGNLPPDTPTMDRSPTLPRLRRSKRVSPTTPTFLSDLEAPPPTKPVVYSPVPTYAASQLSIQKLLLFESEIASLRGAASSTFRVFNSANAHSRFRARNCRGKLQRDRYANEG